MKRSIPGFNPARYGMSQQFDPYHNFVGMVPYMVELARTTAFDDDRTFSYRGFRVGTTLMAMVDGTKEIGIFSHGNLKKQSHTDKVCAERKALQRAQKAGFTRAIGLVVAGTSDREAIAAVSMRPTATLLPCEDCRHRFREHPLVTPDTLVISTGLERDIYQVHTVSELDAYYAGDSDMPEAEVIDLNLENWSSRQSTYNVLRASELTLPAEERRPDVQLARMALTAALPGFSQ
jgi:cytidine deaminase